MKTYTMIVDGRAATAFRAKDDADALRWVNEWAEYAKTNLGAKAEAWTARPATIPEQAAWRRMSVEDTLDGDGDEDFDHLMVSLDEERGDFEIDNGDAN